ncbi:hypothetical protein GN316_06660 [Xylophilus sp. Kf1]|nr:hypothetical protein [Xylophilus sp. Kf1]
MKHLYRVKTPYSSVGVDGVREFKVGDEITLDRASTSRHLELVSTSEPEPARDFVAELTEQLRSAHEQIEGQRDSIQKLIGELKDGIAEAKVLEDKLAAAEAANVQLTSDKDAALAAAAEARDKLAATEAAEAAAVDAAANVGNTAKKK